ncbi:MAG: LamG domain-containing protein [Kofleriaceae bacterium]
MRWWLITIFAAGCGFHVEVGSAGDDQPDPTEPDAGTTIVPRMCSTNDPDLRLCIDFDDSTNLAVDGSSVGHTIVAQNLTPMQRDTHQGIEGAVQVGNQSHVWIAESPALDVAEDLTVAMWIQVDPGSLPTSITNSRWLYDNNTQYFASLRLGGTIRCGSGTVVTDSPPVGAGGTWHHVACTYQQDEMRVYIDGHVAGCEFTDDRDIPTDGDDGFAIGANLSWNNSQGPGQPRFNEHFVGGIDNVQVFSRLLPPAELCAAAGSTTCNTICPSRPSR